jgi:hypothetical protein
MREFGVPSREFGVRNWELVAPFTISSDLNFYTISHPAGVR